MKTRIIILALALIAQLAPLSAETVETSNNGLTYIIDLEVQKATLKALDNKYYSGEIVIYPTIYYGGTFYPVTAINGGAFSLCTYLTSVVIPEGVDSIGFGAFADCTRLTSISIPNSVTSMGEWVFQECKNLKSVRLPEGLTKIETGSFYGCSALTDITIPNSMTVIDDRAFHDCTSLTTITIPNNVTTIGWEAFYGCSSLSSITFPDGLTYIGSDVFAGTPWLTNQPDGVIYVGTIAYRYKGKMPANTTLVLRDGTTAIASLAFTDQENLVGITIPESVTIIHSGVFFNCKNLTNVTLPTGLTTIYNQTFEFCKSLTTITLPESLTKIDDSAFRGCISLTTIDIPDGVTTIGPSVFELCTNLSSITFPSNLQSIGQDALHGTTWLARQPDGVVYIGTIAYCYKGEKGGMPENTQIRLKEGTTSLAGGAFMGSEYEDYYYDELTGDYWAYEDNLTSVVIPESVTSIGYYSFKFRRNLKSVYCDPLTLPTLGSQAFACIEKTENPATGSMSTTATYTHLSKATLYVNHAALATYQAAGEPWNKFGHIVATYALKYVVDGKVYDRYDLLPGDATPDAPTPVMEHCYFSGWSEPTPTTMPDHDVIITGQLYRESIPIFYMVDGEVFKSTTVGYGLPIPHVEAPEKPGFKFDHWEGLPEDNIMPADPVYAVAVYVPQCAKPKLAYSGGQLRVTCTTTGAQCHTTLSNSDVGTHEGSEIQFAVTYVIQSYATAEGLADSEMTTATLCWLNATPEAWGENVTVGIGQTTETPLIIQRHAAALTIEGAQAGTSVSVYDFGGRLLGTATATDGTTLVPLRAAPSTQPIIVQIGQRSVKVGSLK